MLNNRNAVHFVSRSAIDVLAVFEGIEHPSLACIPSKDTGFDGAEICDYEFMIWLRDECRSYELRKHIGNIVVKQVQCFHIAVFHEFPHIA